MVMEIDPPVTPDSVFITYCTAHYSPLRLPVQQLQLHLQLCLCLRPGPRHPAAFFAHSALLLLLSDRPSSAASHRPSPSDCASTNSPPLAHLPLILISGERIWWHSRDNRKRRHTRFLLGFWNSLLMFRPLETTEWEGGVNPDRPTSRRERIGGMCVKLPQAASVTRSQPG